MLTDEQFLTWADRELATKRASLASFASDLHAAARFGWPGRAIDNCDRAFEQAAAIDVITSCATRLRNGSATLAGIRSDALANVHRGAQRGIGSRSTSTISNWLAQCQVAAWAEVLSMLGGVES